MSDAHRPLLLIAYKFPPYAGVGGFRWAKLSKYLARLGYELHVVSAPWPAYGPNTLEADVRDPRIRIHAVHSGSPLSLRHRPLRGRYPVAARHYALRALDRLLFFDDEAQRWAPRLLPACDQLIAGYGIELAIATGHPFQANRFAAELKRRHPKLKLIQDFRDPWVDNPFRRLSSRRVARVRDWQRQAVEAADAVVAVTRGLLKLYLGSEPGPRGHVITNGADPETIPAAGDRSGLLRGDTIRLTHIGNVSNGRDRPLGLLLDALRRLPPGVCQLRLVGAGLDGIRRSHSDLIERRLLEVHSPVAQGAALELVGAGDYALQLNAREFRYLVSTKVYEYAQLGVPTISLNYGGEVDALVREHGFGHSIDLTHCPDLAEFLRSLPGRAAADRDGGFRFDVEPFTHPVLAQSYSALIEDLCSAA
jgi:glycosyltransferase involved in cell wall biosynthesis